MSDHLDVAKLYSVKGLVAVVTGGGSGIGLMCAQALAYNGAKVYIVGRRLEALENASKIYSEADQGKHGSLIPIQGDVTSKASLQEIVKSVSSRESRVDILVNNAGISGPRSNLEAKHDTAQLAKDLWEGEDFEGWQDVLRTNVAAIYFTAVAFLPMLSESTKQVKGHSATIVNICSMSGETKKSQGHLGYNTSKGGAIHLTKLMAQEFVDLKIRVNGINPGYFPSEMSTKEESDDRQKSEFSEFDATKRGVPAGRPGSEEDMAGTILYLCSRAGQYMNAQCLTIDGGFLLSNP